MNLIKNICIGLCTVSLASCGGGTETSEQQKEDKVLIFTKDITIVDTNATYQTKSLLYNLRQVSKKGVMFGHDDALVYGIGWKYDDIPGNCDIKNICGDFPAVFNWDMGHLEVDSTMNLDSVDFDLYREQIVRAYNMGGVNTISWHLRNPVTEGNSWDVTDSTVVASIIEGGSHHELYKTWLKKLAIYFKSLKTEDGTLVPIIFRPYHEHNGSWFWWGEDFCSPEEYVSLWKMTVTYLRDTMDVHNVLYTYSPDKIWAKEDYTKKYPGKEWVDILGIDIYDQPEYNINYFEILPRALGWLREIATQEDKVYALTETGRKNAVDTTWWADRMFPIVKESGVAYLVIWRNHPSEYWAPYPGHFAVDNFVKFYNDSASLFLNDIPNMYTVEE